MAYAKAKRKPWPASHGLSLMPAGRALVKPQRYRAFVPVGSERPDGLSLYPPAGRPKISEVCHREAKTLHRIETAAFSERVMRFKRNKDNPLPADVIVVDEASMLDISLTASLLKP